MDFFSKHNNYFSSTKEIIWNLDDGYSLYNNNSFLVNPKRMSGVSYYNTFRMVLYTLPEDDFITCTNRGFTKDNFMVII